MKPNLVSYEFTEEEFTALKQKITEVQDIVEKFALEIHIDDKNSLQILGNRSIPFTDYAYSQALQQKQLVPAYIDMAEFNKDINLFKQTKDLIQMVEILKERLTDTNAAAGADAFTTARKFYGAIRNALKGDIPGAAVLYEEMRKRYLKARRKDENNNEPQNPAEKKEPVANLNEQQ